MNDQLKQTENQETNAKMSLSRRSFLGKAAVTAPVLAAFVSKPSWSTDNMCINSGTLSGNLSNHACQATSRSASWWANNISLWNNGQVPGVDPSTTFKSIFDREAIGYNPNKQRYYKSKKTDGSVNEEYRFPSDTTIGEVLGGMLTIGTDPHIFVASDVDKAIIASYLNLMHPGIAFIFFNDPNQIKSSYTTARRNYSATPANSIFNELYDLLEGNNGANNNKDIKPGD